jgi:hypothetical protein
LGNEASHLNLDFCFRFENKGGKLKRTTEINSSGAAVNS